LVLEEGLSLLVQLGSSGAELRGTKH
jgi:hypothetical protein